MYQVEGVFQVGLLVSDVDECLRLFRDTLGMKVVFEARNQVQGASGLSGVERQIMNVLMLRGTNGAELEIHQYVDPPAKHRRPMNHNEIGSMHFMLRVSNIEEVIAAVQTLGYEIMTPVVDCGAYIPGFKYAYFRGPDGIMVELHQGKCEMPQG